MKLPASILIADDHDIIRRGIRLLLSDDPSYFVCAEARNGAEAVRKCEELKPVFAILDFNMPELNGLEAASEIRKVSPDTGILMVTVERSDQLTYALLNAGVRGYILKGDCDRDLLKALDALEHHRPFFTTSALEAILDSKHNGESRLTAREQDVLRLIADGQTSEEIARSLAITRKTAEAHRANLMKKLDIHSAADLVRYALRNHIVIP